MNYIDTSTICMDCLYTKEYINLCLNTIEMHERQGDTKKADASVKQLLTISAMTSQIVKTIYDFYCCKHKKLDFPEEHLPKIESFIQSEITLHPLLKIIYSHLARQHLKQGHVEKYIEYATRFGAELPLLKFVLSKCNDHLKTHPKALELIWKKVILLMTESPDDADVSKFASKLVTTTDISERPNLPVPLEYKETPQLFCQTLALKHNPEYVGYISKEDAVGKKYIPHSFKDKNTFLLPVESGTANPLIELPTTIDSSEFIAIDRTKLHDERFAKGDRTAKFLITAAIDFYKSGNFKRATFYLEQLNLKNKRDSYLSSHFKLTKNKARLEKSKTSQAILERSLLLACEMLLCDQNPDKDYTEGWNQLTKCMDKASPYYSLQAHLIAADFLIRHPEFLTTTADAVVPESLSSHPREVLVHYFFETLRKQFEEMSTEDCLSVEDDISIPDQKDRVYRQIVCFYLNEERYDESKCTTYIGLIANSSIKDELSILLNEQQLIRALI